MKRDAHAGFGHPVINPFGSVILISKHTLEALEDRGYLHRDKVSGLMGFDPSQKDIFLQAERFTDHHKEIGEDFSGPNCVLCYCGNCLEKIDVNENRRL
jgi:hypothetical protein